MTLQKTLQTDAKKTPISPNRTALTLGLGKVTWKIHRFRKIRWPNRSSERNLKANLLN